MNRILCFGILAAVFLLSCAGGSQQPVFTDISGRDAEPIKLIKADRTDDNVLQLYFTGQTQLLSAEIFIPESGATEVCIAEPMEVPDDFVDTGADTQKTDGYTAFSLKPAMAIGIGEAFFLRGSVSDTAHGVLDFALPFEGANTRPARLQITEIRPLYSSKPKSEFIEFVVMEGGNLSGITITNVGDKQSPHYTFPSAEVRQGEVIVYHWRSVEDGICDELTAKITSGGTQACPAARDFWGPYTSLPKRNANVILVKTSVAGGVQDALLYCTEKEYAKRSAALGWNDETLTRDAKAAVAGGVWQGGETLSSAVIAPLTASKSLARSTKSNTNTAAAWRLREGKAVTMGSAY